MTSPDASSTTGPRTNTEDLLKIGDFAVLASTNLRTLRYYEELGLILPAKRSQGGFRYYRQTDINRVHMIRDLQALGLPLEQIRELITARASGEGRDAFFRRVRLALSEQDRLLRERIASLEEQRTKIALALEKIHDCASCRHTPSQDNNFCEPCSTTGQSLPKNVSALFQ